VISASLNAFKKSTGVFIALGMIHLPLPIPDCNHVIMQFPAFAPDTFLLVPIKPGKRAGFPAAALD
jgi:hypothetical protein